MTKTVRLPNGVRAVPYRVKCYRPGCRHYTTGYLTTNQSPGGTFYDKRGRVRADLREVDFACREHGIANGSAPFLHRDTE